MTEQLLQRQWQTLLPRLRDKQLMLDSDASLSLRLPGTEAMWFGTAAQDLPARHLLQGTHPALDGPSLHAAIYQRRADVGAIVTGGGRFGQCLADFGGALPQLFDEQARHIGGMGHPASSLASLERSLAAGGNALMVRGQPVCLGITGTRLALNAELFEKCAKAYVLAAATAQGTRPLPWLVRFIANGRLRKDQRRAASRFGLGLLPQESTGY
jgi:hypothetical protein